MSPTSAVIVTGGASGLGLATVRALRDAETADVLDWRFVGVMA